MGYAFCFGLLPRFVPGFVPGDTSLISRFPNASPTGATGDNLSPLIISILRR